MNHSVNVPHYNPLETLPTCYGDPALRDRNHPACAGGADASFVHPMTGKNIRDRCDFFLSCGARIDSMKNIIPPSHLMRPPVITPPAQSPQFAEFLRNTELARRTAIGQPQVPAAPSYAQPFAHPMYPPQQAAPAMAAWAPASYNVPAFLAIQEIHYTDESRWAPFFRMLGRGFLKAGGMIFAHWWDTHVWRQPPPPTPTQEKKG